MPTLREVLNEKAQKYSDKTAFISGEKRYTFKQVNQRINSLTNALTNLGVKKGDRVGILAYNCPQYFEVFMVAKAGMVCVPLNYRSVGRELAYFINNSDVTTIIVEKEFGNVIDSIRAEIKGVKNFICLDDRLENMLNYEELINRSPPNEPANKVIEGDAAALFYTSGTTGLPKGSVHTHKSLIAEMIPTHRYITSDDIALAVMPLFHVGGSAAFLFPCFYAGATTVILKRFDPSLVLQTIEREKITNICLVPTMIGTLLEHPDFKKYNLSSLRTMNYTGAPMPLETLKKGIKELGYIFSQALGQTETNLMTALSKEAHKIGMTEKGSKILESAGQPFYKGEIRVVDEQNHDVPVGEVGELVAKSDRIMKEYWKQPEETAKVMRGGWLHTGDMARKDEEGYVYLVDRTKDMIISGGENIYSREVEQALEKHPAVFEAAVIGVPDERWGESVKALVVLRPGKKATEEELIEFCKDQLASYKKPKSMEFRDSLPKNPSGKILKKEIRDKYWAGYERKIH